MDIGASLLFGLGNILFFNRGLSQGVRRRTRDARGIGGALGGLTASLIFLEGVLRRTSLRGK